MGNGPPHEGSDPAMRPLADFAAWVGMARSFLVDRDDLVARLDAAAARATRTATVVAVVGEFKQGKSALVNSLLVDSVCPVDDHIATAAVTVVSHADTPAVTVRRRDPDGRHVVERVDPHRRISLITDVDHTLASDGADTAIVDRAAVERVDIAVPNELLRSGLVLVDTPGVGGLRRAHADATMAFLRHADAVVFVSDATSELTDTELDFLRAAMADCPTVALAITKIDLFPQWRRIAELDRSHLEANDIDAPIFPVSFPLRVEAAKRRDPELDHESGYPQLTSFLTDQLLPTVRSRAAGRATGDIIRAVGLATESDRTELAALDEPAADAAARLDELRTARERLAGLTGGSAKWRTVLADEITDLNHDVSHHFRDHLRRLLDEMDAAIDRADDAEALEEAGEHLRAGVLTAVERAFDSVDAGVESVTATVAVSLGVDHLDLGTPAEITAAARDAAGGGWVEHEIGPDDGAGTSAFSFLRGAQGGVIMLAVVGGLLPAAAASIVVATPFLVGAGVLFGGKQLVDLRTQKRLRARQRMKQSLRRSVDDVQFRVGAELGDALRVASRFLRDELAQRVDELHRSTVDQIARLDRAAAGDEHERAARRTALQSRLALAHELLSSAPNGEERP